jgi:hypothetical protein
MKTALSIATVMALMLAVPAWAQHQGEQEHRDAQHNDQHNADHDSPRANHGHIPDPPAQRSTHAKPETERWQGGRVNNLPHVDNDHWYGHDKPNDKRYHVDHPFEHGRFEHFGPSYRYTIERVDLDAHRFWLPGGFFFEVASWDWPLAANWCWNCGDDFVVYDDPDHPGWYLLYNLHTGRFVHVMYMGG